MGGINHPEVLSFVSCCLLWISLTASCFGESFANKGSAYTHEKKTKLSKHQFEQILRTFGFLCLKIGKVEYGSQLIHDLLEQSVGSFICLKIIADDFLYAIDLEKHKNKTVIPV